MGGCGATFLYCALPVGFKPDLERPLLGSESSPGSTAHAVTGFYTESASKSAGWVMDAVPLETTLWPPAYFTEPTAQLSDGKDFWSLPTWTAFD